VYITLKLHRACCFRTNQAACRRPKSAVTHASTSLPSAYAANAA